MTQGPDPVVVEEDGKVQKFPVTKLLKGKLIDTNGAGTSSIRPFIRTLNVYVHAQADMAGLIICLGTFLGVCVIKLCTCR